MDDLYNVRSVRLAETTKVKLFLPGLGSGLWEEEEENNKSGASTSDAKRAKKRLAKMRNACHMDAEDDGGVTLIIEEKAPDEDQGDDSEDDSDSDDAGLPTFLFPLPAALPPAQPEPKKKKPLVDKWTVGKKDPWAKQSGRNAPIVGQNAWSDLNRQGSENGEEEAGPSVSSGGGMVGGGSSAQGPERSASSSAAIPTSGHSTSMLSNSPSRRSAANAGASGASQSPRVPVWDRLTAASQSKNLPPPSPQHSDSGPRVLKAVQAKTLGFNWGPGASSLVLASDPNAESTSSSLYGIYDTGQWTSGGSGGGSGREISPSRQGQGQGQGRLQNLQQRFGSPGAIASSLSRRRANSNPALNPPPGSSRPPSHAPSASSLSGPQGPAVAAMASLFQASMGILQTASGSESDSNKRQGGREGLITPRGIDRDSQLSGGGGGSIPNLPNLPTHQLQMTDPGGEWKESTPRPFTTSTVAGNSPSLHQRAATASTMSGGGSAPKLASVLYPSSLVSGRGGAPHSPSRR